MSHLYKHSVSCSAGVSNLSSMERVVFKSTGNGYTVKEIAADLDLSPKTVYTYRERICRKLSLDDAAALLYAAMSYIVLGEIRRCDD